jgi:hypothetical protein
VNVQISLLSGLDDKDPSQVTGEMSVDEDTLTIAWMQPAGPDEMIDSVYQLVYVSSTGLLSMTRMGDFRTDLTFSSDASVRTRGLMHTMHGDFAMDIETRELIIPYDIWQFVPEGAKDGTSGPFSGRTEIRLHYYLLLSGSEPMENRVVIRIGLDNHVDTV